MLLSWGEEMRFKRVFGDRGFKTRLEAILRAIAPGTLSLPQTQGCAP